MPRRWPKPAGSSRISRGGWSACMLAGADISSSPRGRFGAPGGEGRDYFRGGLALRTGWPLLPVRFSRPGASFARWKISFGAGCFFLFCRFALSFFLLARNRLRNSTESLLARRAVLRAAMPQPSATSATTSDTAAIQNAQTSIEVPRRLANDQSGAQAPRQAPPFAFLLLEPFTANVHRGWVWGHSRSAPAAWCLCSRILPNCSKYLRRGRKTIGR